MIQEDMDALGHQIKEYFGVEIEQLGNNQASVNMHHLLKATNHLRAAQREFQIAKQLSSGKKKSNQALFGNENPYGNE